MSDNQAAPGATAKPSNDRFSRTERIVRWSVWILMIIGGLYVVVDLMVLR